MSYPSVDQGGRPHKAESLEYDLVVLAPDGAACGASMSPVLRVVASPAGHGAVVLALNPCE